MKLKPLHIYGIVVLAGIIFIVATMMQTNNPPITPTQETPHQETPAEHMPDDDIHKGLTSGDAPSRANVSESFKHTMEQFKKEIDEHPNDTAKLKQFADFLASAHKTADAIQYYEKILSIDGKRTDVLFALAYIFHAQQKLDKALEVTNKILSMEKDNPQALYNLGAIAASQGDNKKAKAIWEDLLKKQPHGEMSAMTKQSIEQLK
ncbi:MAG: tetratricopeptide repeat protein [Ignavibacteriales bacterium]|nr:tetratricopeptide repeat protein [Ignavibacteriales bacterium]